MYEKNFIKNLRTNSKVTSKLMVRITFLLNNMRNDRKHMKISYNGIVKILYIPKILVSFAIKIKILQLIYIL